MTSHRSILRIPRGGSGRKVKRNPSAICKSCGEKIFNRYRGSLYCIRCSRPVRDINSLLSGYISQIRKRFPSFKILCKIKVTKK